jgi:hypothetical protein
VTYAGRSPAKRSSTKFRDGRNSLLECINYSFIYKCNRKQ